MFDTLLLDVWISDETLLAFDILLLDVWISDETLLAFDILLLVIWISNETLLTFDTLFLSARISDKTLFVFQWYYHFSLFGYHVKHFTRVWSITLQCLEIRLTHLVFDVLLLDVWISDKTLLLVFDIFKSVFGYLMKHFFSCLIY